MSYRINEFRLALPDAAVQDSSINILRFEALATSLIISRSLLAEGETLQSNFDGQLQRLQQQVKDLRMQPAQAVQVGAGQAIAAIELSSQFSKGQEKVYQYQLALVLPGTRKMFALSYVKASPLGAAEAAHWASIKQSLDFDSLG
ncbi:MULTISPECIES: DcrB-related protein [Pseudomonas]|uniref:DcrB-related protein n=1 Tax=Pseudomonas TaxID=286 RepID=UPI001EDFC977|nr:DcrB-related protein [Pseudomonas shirazica]